jgi:4-amino-4-deoxy-L-arabinose transferase-like glycosyltransferase
LNCWVSALPRLRISKLDLFLIATLALCIARLWLMELPSSFWVDEMGTVFVVHHGAADPTLQAAPQVADSIYYSIPAFAEKLFGTSEISYRIFSAIAMGLALFFVARIAARLVDPRAAWFAVFGCLALKTFNYEAADARPYALATLVLCCAIYLLIRWLDSGRLVDGILFAIAAATLWWVHLLLWPFYPLFAIYTLFRIRSVNWLQIGIVTALIIAGTVPVAMRSLALLHQAGAHVVVPKPEMRELTAQLQLNLITGVCTVAFLVARWFGWGPQRAVSSTAPVVIMAGWWLLDPLVIYGFSHVSGTSVFVSRYMYAAAPGIVLTILLLVGLLIPPDKWKCVALALGVCVLAFSGHWRYRWPPHHNSDWRGAAAALRQWTGGDDQIPVICPSPFVEARPPVWTPGYPTTSFLYSNVDYYPMGGRLYTFPYQSEPELAPETEAYARQLSAERLSQSPRFAIYGGDTAVKFWQIWFQKQPRLLDWKSRVLGRFGDVEIVVFEPPR